MKFIEKRDGTVNTPRQLSPRRKAVYSLLQAYMRIIVYISVLNWSEDLWELEWEIRKDGHFCERLENSADYKGIEANTSEEGERQ